MVYRCKFCNGVYNQFTRLINHQQTHRHIFRNRRELFRPSEQYKLFVVVPDSSPDQEVNPIIDLTMDPILISSDSESENQQPVSRPYGSGSSHASSEGEVSSEDNITVLVNPKKRTSSEMERDRIDQLLAISGYNPDTAQYELTACHLPIHYVGYTPPWLRPSSSNFDHQTATPNTIFDNNNQTTTPIFDNNYQTPNTSSIFDNYQTATPNTPIYYDYNYHDTTDIIDNQTATPNTAIVDNQTPTTSTNSQNINQEARSSRPRTILRSLPMRRRPMRRLPMHRTTSPLLIHDVNNSMPGPSTGTVVRQTREEDMFWCPKCPVGFRDFEDLRGHNRTHIERPN